MKYLPFQILGLIPNREQHCFGHIEDLITPSAGSNSRSGSSLGEKWA